MEGRSSVQEIDYTAESEARQTSKTGRRDPAISLGPALVAKPLCRAQEKRTMREIEVQIGNSGL
jgi:hypothetical protein